MIHTPFYFIVPSLPDLLSRTSSLSFAFLCTVTCHHVPPFHKKLLCTSQVCVVGGVVAGQTCVPVHGCVLLPGWIFRVHFAGPASCEVSVMAAAALPDIMPHPSQRLLSHMLTFFPCGWLTWECNEPLPLHTLTTQTTTPPPALSSVC